MHGTTRPAPTQKETFFDFDELFFSRTDLHGVIRFGNEVFVRISGYSREEMIGAPHNIIRHPDMPRSVFKLFWDTIQKGLPIVAYVKNMSASGNHYWVLAAAFPIRGGYLSIRLRPSSEFFAKAQSVYQQVFAEEKQSGVAAAETRLLALIQAAGFRDYPEFMTAALLAELKARDAQLTGAGIGAGAPDTAHAQDRTAEAMRRIKTISAMGTRELRNAFLQVDEFGKAYAVFEERTSFLLAGFRAFRLISLNLGVAASRHGQAGGTLAVVARDFQNLAQEIERHLKDFSASVAELKEGMRECSLHVGSLKLQMEMLDFFVRESLRKTSEGDVTLAQAFESLEANRKEFTELTGDSEKVAKLRLADLDIKLRKFSTATEEIKTFVNGLQVISQMGSVESARISADDTLGTYIRQMNAFSQTLRDTSTEILQATRTLEKTVKFTRETIQKVSGTMEAIFDAAFSVQLKGN